ncbi:MAG: hypothetical protein JWM89_4038 [Acidimicrobiales bacterium]|nr:hypothetical protein [Acidimicrobiales bacterium]
MPDEQDAAEALDDDELSTDELGDAGEGWEPPDRPPGVQAYGAAGGEPHATESVIARAAREEPEELPDDIDADGNEVQVEGEEWGDDQPAEVAALHAVDEGLGDFDSDVDDPDLEAAWETDPEVDR